MTSNTSSISSSGNGNSRSSSRIGGGDRTAAALREAGQRKGGQGALGGGSER